MVAGGGGTIDAPRGHPAPPGYTPSTPAVRLSGVHKAYGEVVAIEDLSLEVRPGQVGTPGEIYERPVNEFVAAFVGTSNILERDGRCYMVRPEKIRLLAPGEVDAGATDGRVAEVAYLGSVTRYVVRSDAGETIVVLRQNLDMSAERALQERGRNVRLAWRVQDASVFDPGNEEETPQR